MIIHVTPQGAVELREPNDFKNFKIAAGCPADALAGALKGLAALEPDGKTAWVSGTALKTLAPQAPDWAASFDKMVESVKRFGWVRDDGTVRAHIEAA
jgi:hypothetical protein